MPTRKKDEVVINDDVKQRILELLLSSKDFLRRNWIIGIIVTVGALLVLVVQQIILSLLNRTI